MGSPPRKINLISCGPMAHVSDIKLIRTDTTLDLSQKAEKGMIQVAAATVVITSASSLGFGSPSCVGLCFFLRRKCLKTNDTKRLQFVHLALRLYGAPASGTFHVSGMRS